MNHDANMIVAVPFERPRAALRAIQPRIEPDFLPTEPGVHDQRLVKIRTADSHGQRTSANILVDRMYATRGYACKPMPAQQVPSRVTLVAVDHEETVGTLTVGFDSERGLNVDQLFSEECASLRMAGRQVCEFTTLAMDSVVRSKRVLASLFHVAYIYAHRLKGCDDLLIEVNPRHVLYYRRMLGFEVMGPQRHNPRVDAPAVMLRLRLAHAREQIDRFAGLAEEATGERSLYPYFFSLPEETGIVARLKRTWLDASVARARAPLFAPARSLTMQ